MLNDFLSSREMIDVLVDEGDAEVVVTASVKALRVDSRTDLVIVGLTRVMVDALVGGMIGLGVDMLTALGIVEVVASAIALEVFETVSLEDSLSFCC